MSAYSIRETSRAFRVADAKRTPAARARTLRRKAERRFKRELTRAVSR
jgi:hypothetical protein